MNTAEASRSYSLVKGSKSPTRHRRHVAEDKTIARLVWRPWNGQYRIRLETHTPHGQPPEQAGDRITHTLSPRGKRAIAECCEYVTAKHGGFDAFFTLTLDEAARARIDTRAFIRTQEKQPDPIDAEAAGPFCPVRLGWASSIQREASRFFEACAKMYARGWVAPYSRGRVIPAGADNGAYTSISTEPVRIAGSDKPLLYCWVAENPVNADGERNPHIHVLMRWSVPWAVFTAWAHRIERLWGQGFAHLEKLRAKAAAGYYIAKAAGYLSKGAGNTDQGPIRGNRYGISRAARAPGWVQVSSFAWGILGDLISEARDRIAERLEPLRKARDRAAENLKHAKGSARRRIARDLLTARQRIAALGHATRWGITLTSEAAAHRFLEWATREGWTREARPAGLWLSTWRAARKAARWAVEAAKRSLDDLQWFFLLREDCAALHTDDEGTAWEH